jgi:hypothetical protein
MLLTFGKPRMAIGPDPLFGVLTSAVKNRTLGALRVTT